MKNNIIPSFSQRPNACMSKMKNIQLQSIDSTLPFDDLIVEEAEQQQQIQVLNIQQLFDEHHRRQQEFDNKLFIALLIVVSIALVTSLYFSQTQ